MNRAGRAAPFPAGELASRGLPMVLAAVLSLVACGGVELAPIPEPPSLERMDPAVREQYTELRAQVDEAASGSKAGAAEERAALAEAMGELGMWFHAYSLAEGALAAYGNAFDLQPETPRWAYYRGMLLAEGGQLEEALSAFAAALDHAASAAERIPMEVRSAELELLAGRADAAAARLEAVVNPASDENVRGLVALADAYRTLGRTDDAIELYQQALHAQEEASGVHYLLGLALRDAGREQEATLFMARVRADARPDTLRMQDPWAAELMVLDIGYFGQLRRGRRLASSGQPRRALHAFRLASVLDPEHPDARFGAARMHLELGQLDDAADISRDLLARFPESAESHSLSGRVAARQGDHELAERRYRRAVELDPALLPTWRQLTALLRSQGRVEEAAETLEASHRLSPSDSDLICALAETWAELGRRDDARELLERTLGFADEPWAQRLLLEELGGSSGNG